MSINIFSQPVVTTPFSECYKPKLSFKRQVEKLRAIHLEVEETKAKGNTVTPKTIDKEREEVVRELMARRSGGFNIKLFHILTAPRPENMWNKETSLAIRLAVLNINALLSVDLDEDVWNAMIASDYGHKLIVGSMLARYRYWVANWRVITYAKSIKAHWGYQEYLWAHLENTEPGDPFIFASKEHNEQIPPTTYSPPARLEIIEREAPGTLKRRRSDFEAEGMYTVTEANDTTELEVHACQNLRSYGAHNSAEFSKKLLIINSLIHLGPGRRSL
ncbi:hypothetical protein BJ165DRAFT_1496551 [Panaeolus papilionaceus]|nr:hypothetical protein BJ165DRAFT_1496551 [Panaeolus papilionaceus]